MARLPTSTPWWRRALVALGLSRPVAALPPRSRRSYEGASRSRRTQGWRAPSTGPNAALSGGLTALRDRSRDLVRNDPHARSAIYTYTSAAVADGVDPRPRLDNANLTARVLRLWRAWEPLADTATPLGLYGLQIRAWRAWLESGEVLLRRRPRRLNELAHGETLPVPLQLEILEADHIDSTKTGALERGHEVKQGIEYDALGRVTAIWLYRRHPGERDLLSGGLESVAVPIDSLAHLYDPERPGQLRGVPMLAPILLPKRDLGDYQDAERVRARSAACLVGFVHGGDDEAVEDGRDGIADSVTDSDGRIVESFEPGQIAYLPGGKSITISQPPGHANGAPAWVEQELRTIARGVGLTYEQLSGDLSKVNYSSIKFGTVDFRHRVRQFKVYFERMVLARVWRWFITDAIAAGLLPEQSYPVEWAWTPMESPDPNTEATAKAKRLAMGLDTWQDVLAEEGRDWREHLDKIREEREAAAKAGVLLDYDPLLRLGADALPTDSPSDAPPKKRRHLEAV